MIRDKLDPEERELLESVERGEWVSVMTPESKERARVAAVNTLKNLQSLQLHIPDADLRVLQRRASEEGVPYELFVADILHKYVEGSLVEKVT